MCYFWQKDVASRNNKEKDWLARNDYNLSSKVTYPPCQRVCLVIVNIIIISSTCDLFTQWYIWEITHSLIYSPKTHSFKHLHNHSPLAQCSLIGSLTLSLTHPLYRSLTHSIAHSPTLSLTHPLYRSLTISFTHPLYRSLTLSLTHPLYGSLIHSIAHSPTLSLTHTLYRSLTHYIAHSPAHSLAHSLYRSLTHCLRQTTDDTV